MPSLWADCSQPKPKGQPPGLLQGTYPGGCGHHTVREHKEVQAHQLEDVFEEVDDLQGQHVLGTEDMQGGQLASSCSYNCPGQEGRRSLPTGLSSGSWDHQVLQ